MTSPHPTREVLIDVALTLFATDGYRGTTIRKIEEAAGLAPGAGGMYRHFRSKDALLLAAVDRYRAEVTAFLGRAGALMQLGDVRAELRVAATLFREFNERNEALLRVLLLEQDAIPAQARRHFEQAWEDGYRFYARWLTQRLPAGSPVDVAAAAIQVFGSLAQYQMQAETFDRPPLGVDPDRFVEAWVNHWAAFIALGPAARDPAPRPVTVRLPPAAGRRRRAE